LRVFKTKRFAKWAKKEKLGDDALCGAVKEISQGLVEAKLGELVYKKRVASRGRGKRGSSRTLVAFQYKTRAFFMFGFEKNKLSNIAAVELSQLNIMADRFVNFNDAELRYALDESELIEVIYYE
jgi:hypothetical protein